MIEEYKLAKFALKGELCCKQMAFLGYWIFDMAMKYIVN